MLLRHGRNRLRLPERKIFRRCEKSRAGEWIHLALKHLYRPENTHREYAFAAMDDHSREAFAQIRPDRGSRDAAAFLEQLVAKLPYRIEARLIDNDRMFTMRYAFHGQRKMKPISNWHSLSFGFRFMLLSVGRALALQPRFLQDER